MERKQEVSSRTGGVNSKRKKVPPGGPTDRAKAADVMGPQVRLELRAEQEACLDWGHPNSHPKGGIQYMQDGLASKGNRLQASDGEWQQEGRDRPLGTKNAQGFGLLRISQ